LNKILAGGGMKRFFRIFLIALFISRVISIFAVEGDKIANDLLASMVKGDFKSAELNFNDELKKQIPEAVLKNVWDSLQLQYGRYVKNYGFKAEKNYFINTLEFEKTNLDMKVFIDQSGKIAGLLFVPSTTVKESRYQTPKKPYPYDEKEVVFFNGGAGVKLAGTLTLPRVKEKVPAVILITGSGTQDRDETIAGHKPFLVIADYLTRHGIAVLRVDDRGIGGSTAGDMNKATTLDFAGDIRAGIDFLKTQSEIDIKKIGLIGHSEGGMIAPMVASKSNDVAFIVLLAGPGLTGKEVTLTQTEAILKAGKMDNALIKKEISRQENCINIVLSESDEKIEKDKLEAELKRYYNELSETEKKELGELEAFIKRAIPIYMLPWQKYFLLYDPRIALKEVRCPVLALNGEKDMQVLPKANLAAIEKALKAGGNKDFTIKELPNLNHLFQNCTTGSLDEYGKIDETFSQDALKIIGDWIVKHTK
jgi:uncharacterized protein